jgi:hypothetical protein
MSEEVFDVILQSTGHFHAGVFTYQQNRSPEEGFSLGLSRLIRPTTIATALFARLYLKAKN